VATLEVEAGSTSYVQGAGDDEEVGQQVIQCDLSFSFIFHYVASIVFATEFNRSKPFIKPKDFRISNNYFNLINF